MSNLGKETSRQTFRDKLLDNNKLLVGSVAVLFITSFTFGATFIGLSHGNSEERSQPKTVNNNTVQETVHKTTPSNDNSEVQSVSMNNKEQKYLILHVLI